MDVLRSRGVLRLKHAARVIMGQSPVSEDYVPYHGSEPFLQGNAEFGDIHPSPRYSCGSAGKKAQPGDILFSVRAPVGAINLANDSYGIGRGLCAIRPMLLDSKFAWYVMHAVREEIVSQAVGSTYGAVTAHEVGNTVVPCPPMEEQRAIVRFLDEETAKINALIEKRHSLISMLDQKGAAMREQLFTCSQGQPGMTLPRIKTVLIEVNERVGSRDDVELLTVSHLTGVTPRAEKNVSMFMAESFDDYKVCQVGDVVVNTMWAWAGAAGIARTGGMVSPAYAVYRPRRGVEVNADFFDLLLRSPGFVRLMAAFSEGVWRSRLRLYPDVFLSLPLVLPDISEQKRLVAEVMTELDNDERLRRLASQSVDTTLEYRSALITAAVTGQTDVGSAA